MKRNQVLGIIVVLGLMGLTACQGKVDPNSSAGSGLQRINFDYNSAVLSPDMTRILDKNGDYLKKHNSLEVVLEGHCDERGTNEYNLALGDRRAGNTKSYLERRGVAASNLRTVSYGEEKPADPGHHESAWYLNRRVEFVKKSGK